LELAPSAGRSFGGSEATFCGLPATELWNCPPLQKRRDPAVVLAGSLPGGVDCMFGPFKRPRLFWSSFTLWQSSQPGPVRFQTLQTLQVRFAQTAQGTADFAASLVIAREQKELTSSLILTAPAADAGASFIRRVGTTSARLGLALWDGRPNRPIPRTRSPSPSPGCVSRRGFVFRPDAGFIEDEVGAQRFSFS
jgi:hypothetical protein